MSGALARTLEEAKATVDTIGTLIGQCAASLNTDPVAAADHLKTAREDSLKLVAQLTKGLVKQT